MNTLITLSVIAIGVIAYILKDTFTELLTGGKSVMPKEFK